LLSFHAGNWASASSEQNNGAGDSIQDLTARVGKLEAQVAALQKQIKALASKPSPTVLTVPGTPSFPGKNIPPGAKEYEINGMKYWLVPVKESR
jgi:hypothetical protein